MRHSATCQPKQRMPRHVACPGSSRERRLQRDDAIWSKSIDVDPSNNNARRNGNSRLEWRRTVTRIARTVLLTTILLSGCSIRKFAINKLGDSLANSGATFASDDDPEFVGQAVPFSLKLIEGLIAESPKHRGLLFAASSGFAQYSYVYVQQPAEELEERDLEQSNVLRARARKLYLRARDYGLQGLEAKHPRFATMLRENPETALRRTKKTDVPLLYWTALSWGAAISVSKDHPEL